MKTIRRKGSEYCVIQFLKYNSSRPNGKKYIAYVKLGSSTSLAETPTCCETCAALEESSAEKTFSSETADGGGAAVRVGVLMP